MRPARFLGEPGGVAPLSRPRVPGVVAHGWKHHRPFPVILVPVWCWSSVAGPGGQHTGSSGRVCGVVGVSARCWVLREQAPPRCRVFLLSRVGGWGRVCGVGVVVSVAVGVPVAHRPVLAGVGVAVVLRWPWGVCELDSGCEHLDLIDLFRSLVL